MHILLSLIATLVTQHSASEWSLLAGWIVGVVGTVVGLIGASIGAMSYARGRQRHRGYGELLSQLEQHWRDRYTDEQVRALIAEHGRLLEQIHLEVPDHARYMLLQDQQQALSKSITALYRKYEDTTQRLAGGGQTGDGLRPDLLKAIELDLMPAYLERQRREFWVSISVIVLLLLASVPLGLPLLYPLASLVGVATTGGTTWWLAQAYDYIVVCGISYLILRVAPGRRRTPGTTRPGGLLRVVLPYVLLAVLWFAVTVQFFLPYLMTAMGGLPLAASASYGDASKHAALGIVSAVLSAILLRWFPPRRHEEESLPTFED